MKKNILIGVLIAVCCLSLFYASVKASEANRERQLAQELQEQAMASQLEALEQKSIAERAAAEALSQQVLAENAMAQLMECQNN